MAKVASKADDQLLANIKKDIAEDQLPNTERSYQVLDDGTLIVHVWSERVLTPQTYRINMSIGREMKPSEWKTNGETPNEG